jgi:hypothetical protein
MAAPAPSSSAPPRLSPEPTLLDVLGVVGLGEAIAGMASAPFALPAALLRVSHAARRLGTELLKETEIVDANPSPKWLEMGSHGHQLLALLARRACKPHQLKVLNARGHFQETIFAQFLGGGWRALRELSVDYETLGFDEHMLRRVAGAVKATSGTLASLRLIGTPDDDDPAVVRLLCSNIARCRKLKVLDLSVTLLALGGDDDRRPRPSCKMPRSWSTSTSTKALTPSPLLVSPSTPCALPLRDTSAACTSLASMMTMRRSGPIRDWRTSARRWTFSRSSWCGCA